MHVWRLSVWHLSVAYIGPKSRTDRPRKTKIGTEVAHVTRDSDTTFKVKRSTCCWCLKDHRQRIPRFVIRRYLEKSIQKKLFCHLQSLQIKTFPRKKTIINSISENLLSRFIYGRDVIGANCVEQRLPENGKWNVFTTTTIIITTERNTVNHYDKIYGVFETLTNK